jgi:transcriptional antiterminator RfaH
VAWPVVYRHPLFMPILAEEPTLYPEGLLDEVAPAEGDRRWWAVYTRSRQEKSLARQLHALRIPYYLPLVPKASFSGGRRVKSLLPLFGSYVFMFADEVERLDALGTHRIAHVFKAPSVAEMTRDLRNVRSLIASGAPLTVEARLREGQRVRVKHGSLMGIEGMILSRRGEDRLLVAVEFLQQGVSILINDFQVEPV